MTPSPVDRTHEHLEVLADALTLPSEGAERRGERRGQLRYYVRATTREPWGRKWNRFWSSRWFWSCGRLGPVPGLYYADYWKRP